MDARYAFRVRVRLRPRQPGISLEPATVETTVYREADEPGTDGWLFFRDALWRGEVGDREHARGLAEGWLDLPVEAVSFRALHTDEAYFDALKREIAADPEPFNADDERVSDVLTKYLGSSVIVDGGSGTEDGGETGG